MIAIVKDKKNGSPDTGSNVEAAGEGTNRSLFFIKESAFSEYVFFAVVNSKPPSFP